MELYKEIQKQKEIKANQIFTDKHLIDNIKRIKEIFCYMLDKNLSETEVLKNKFKLIFSKEELKHHLETNIEGFDIYFEYDFRHNFFNINYKYDSLNICNIHYDYEKNKILKFIKN